MKKTYGMFAAMFIAAILLSAGLAQAAPSLKVSTDKNNYAVGEEVQITATNQWNDYIVTGYGYTITTPDGDIVWDGIWIEIAIAVPPGEALEYIWDQTYLMSSLGADGEQVAPGHYFVEDRTGGQTQFWITSDVLFETVDQGTYSGYPSDVSGEYFVIRDDAAWKAFWTDHKSYIFPAPEKPDINFSTEMVICAFHGVYPTNGAGVVIESVSHNGDHWDVDVTRSTGGGILPVVTNPYHLITTPYTDLPVEFDVTEIVV